MRKLDKVQDFVDAGGDVSPGLVRAAGLQEDLDPAVIVAIMASDDPAQALIAAVPSDPPEEGM